MTKMTKMIKVNIFDRTSASGRWNLAFMDGRGNPAYGTMYCTCLEAAGYRTVRFSSDSYEAGEGSGTALISVELSEPSTMTTTVKYATVPEQGSNQQPQHGILTFLPGEEILNLAIAITDDETDEPDEAMRLTLSEAGNQYGLGTPTQATLLIVVDDELNRTVSFSSDSYEASEGDGTVLIPVQLSTPSTMTTSVKYATIPAPGSNQQAQSGTLMFLPGEVTLSVGIDVQDDEIDEPDEMLTLSLNAVDNEYNLGMPVEATLLIIDDDDEQGFWVYLPGVVSASAPSTP